MAGDRGDKVLVLVRITGGQRTGTCLGSVSCAPDSMNHSLAYSCQSL